jgi:DNA topoisomerase-1
METITLEEALDLFKFPRQLGEFEEKPVSVGIGRFGPYITFNKVNYKIPKGKEADKLTFEETMEIIAKGGDSKKKTTKKTTKKAAPKATKKETKKKE